MTFIKKHALKFFIILTVFAILFLLWYHLFPLKITFDHTLYSEKGEEAILQGEVQYYRSLFSDGRLYGEIKFNGIAYDGRLGTASPDAFMFVSTESKGNIIDRDFVLVLLNDDYKISYIVERTLGKENKIYFPQKP